MEELKTVLIDCINSELFQVVLSGSRRKDGPVKLKARPVMLQGSLKFQMAVSDGKKEFHFNYGKEELVDELIRRMGEDFRQLYMETSSYQVTALMSKKGKVTIKKKKRQGEKKAPDLEHNRTKQYLLAEGTPVPFLVDLGVQTPEGKTVRSRYDKFRQINRFLEFIEDVRPSLDTDRKLTIIDFGCGKSYLTFAMYYYLKIQKGMDIRIIGLDLKEDVIDNCSALARKYGYGDLIFLKGDIASYDGVDQVDMVVTLHACDTATDYALQKAVAWNARVILSVPCCQHELNGQMRSEVLEPLFKYGLIKERMAALATDAFRAGLLEEAGYNVQILEFIDMEHTPKNILIRGVRNGKIQKDEKLKACMEFLGVEPTLDKLLSAKGEA